MKRIFEFLKSKKINGYFPGQHKGICNEAYVVIHKAAQLAELGNNKVGIQAVNLLIYAPLNSYIKAEEFENTVKMVAKEIDFLRKTGFESPWIIEDDISAYSKSIEYEIQKELEG